MDHNRMPKELYRYRPLDIGATGKTVVDELKSQEIYLGTLADNNDPMDGFQQVVWQGDDVCWHNLIRHYCLCLLHSLVFVHVAGESEKFGPETIRVDMVPDDAPTPAFRALYDDFVGEVLASENSQQLLDVLNLQETIHKEQLSLVLFLHHRLFLDALAGATRKHLKFDAIPSARDLLEHIEEVHLKPVLAGIPDEHMRTMGEVAEVMHDQLYLLHLYNAAELRSTGVDNLVRYLTRFPSYYVESLSKSIWPEYYLAAFSERKDSASMWGHYAQGHQGVCLVFELDDSEERPRVALEDGRHLPLYRVCYDAPPSPANFFANLGHLPHGKLVTNWLQHEGRTSEYASRYGDSFHRDYWDRYTEKVSYKLVDWSYEREFRAVMNSFPGDSLGPEDRLVRYRFEQLAGIVFGIRTPVETQIEILRVIDEKLQGHDDREFRFWKACFSGSRERMDTAELRLIKFTR
jgi:hypothetical protein